MCTLYSVLCTPNSVLLSRTLFSDPRLTSSKSIITFSFHLVSTILPGRPRGDNNRRIPTESIVIVVVLSIVYSAMYPAKVGNRHQFLLLSLSQCWVAIQWETCSAFGTGKIQARSLSYIIPQWRGMNAANTDQSLPPLPRVIRDGLSAPKGPPKTTCLGDDLQAAS
jgi:hypothetical protein